MWNGDSRSADQFGVWTDADYGDGLGSSCSYAHEDVVVAIVAGSTCHKKCLSICMLLASAYVLPIRPVLKHKPRSLTFMRVNR